MTYIALHPERVAALALVHLTLVVVALVVALIVALPIGMYAVRRPRVAPWILGVLGAMYTIPSLALLALFVQAFGLGSVPIFIALVIYAQFMLVRNIVVGLRGVDPAALDAARGIGFSEFQSLTRVRFPLAMPVIVGGVRIATVAMIAIATLGGYVGGSGLGVLIFNGLTLHNDAMILAGSVAASILAIVADGALRIAERAARARTRG